MVENPLNISTTGYAVIECFHIAGFALAIGMTALVDFRLLGLGLTRQAPAQIARAFEWWTLGGLVVAIFSGLLILSTDADMYYLNRAFWTKMACLVAAITFSYTIHWRAVFRPWALGVARIVACVSLVLWVSVILGGIFIAVISPGLI